MQNLNLHAIPRHEHLDVTGLHWISRFGWLRFRELGAFLWPHPHSKSSERLEGTHKETVQRKAAHRIVQRWAERRWVIQRQLPAQGGIGVVLSASGARYVQSRLRTPIRSGENWGRASGGTWSPPSSWEHELLVSIFLTRFWRQGFEIKTELEIRSENPGQVKIPDGLVLYPSDSLQDRPTVFWVEMESAEKAGRKMLALASTITLIHRGNAPCLSGWCATNAMLAFRSDHVDLAGKPIDHKLRLVSAVGKHIGASVDATFAQLEILNAAYHLGDIHLSMETIDPLSSDPSELNFAGKRFHSNVLGAYELICVDRKGDPWTLKVCRSQDRFRWEIWDSTQERAGFHIESLEDAFRVVVERWRRDFF